MIKRRLKYVVALLLLIEVSFCFLTYKSYSYKEVDKINEENKINKEMFAMYVEQDDGTYKEGEYFPGVTYELNYDKTNCVDNKKNNVSNDIVTYTNGKLTVSSSKTVFCYLYFENEAKAYAIYSDTDNSLTFYKNKDSEGIGSTYNNKNVTAIYSGFESTNYTSASAVPWNGKASSIKSVEVKEEINPISLSYWFYNLTNTSELNLEKLNTSEVTNMKYAFYNTGYNAKTFETDIGDFDTSKVTDMYHAFENIGYSAEEWSIGDLSNWNTSKNERFNSAFAYAGYSAKSWDIGNLSTKSATKDGETYIAWDTSSLINANNMFNSTAYTSSKFNIGDIGTWDVSNINNFDQFIRRSGYNASEWYIGDLSNWNTSKMQHMVGMFSGAGYNANEFNIGDIGNWNVSKVSDLGWCFDFTGANASTFYIGDLSNWDTSNVTKMVRTFANTGENANWSMDLSNWNVNKVIYYYEFNHYNESKITPPKWVNEDVYVPGMEI